MPFAEVVSRAQLADTVGFDGVWGFDHFQPMYGEGPGEVFDGVTTLAALSGLTSRIRLGLLVTGVTYRHPSVFATQMVTIDHASHGRLTGQRRINDQYDQCAAIATARLSRLELVWSISHRRIFRPLS